MMRGPNSPFERAMALAALSGLKIALGPAFLAASRRQPSARQWALAAMGEMVLDKLNVFPPRYRPSLLIPHTLSGAWVARESLKADGVNDPWAVAAGAVVAAGVASVAPMVRMTLNGVMGIPEPVLGLGEDLLALRLGTEATGLSMDEVKELAAESTGSIREQVAPTLRSIGVEV